MELKGKYATVLLYHCLDEAAFAGCYEIESLGDSFDVIFMMLRHSKIILLTLRNLIQKPILLHQPLLKHHLLMPLIPFLPDNLRPIHPCHQLMPITNTQHLEPRISHIGLPQQADQFLHGGNKIKHRIATTWKDDGIGRKEGLEGRDLAFEGQIVGPFFVVVHRAHEEGREVYLGQKFVLAELACGEVHQDYLLLLVLDFGVIKNCTDFRLSPKHLFLQP